jgi:hypothetical protein
LRGCAGLALVKNPTRSFVMTSRFALVLLAGPV